METLNVGSSKVQRIACVTVDRKTKKKKLRAHDFRVAAIATKQDLEVPVAVNQGEKELALSKILEDPQLWRETEFPHAEEEVAGMKKEVKSTQDFEVFDEVPVEQVADELSQQAISTKWVRTRKGDGTVRCRLVARGYTQQVDDKDEILLPHRR